MSSQSVEVTGCPGEGWDFVTNQPRGRLWAAAGTPDVDGPVGVCATG